MRFITSTDWTSLHHYIKMSLMRTTITLDDEAYEAAQTLAKTSGKRLGEVISQLIRRAVQTPEAARPKRGKRFPSFQVPPGTPMISLRAVRKAWEEE